MTEHSLTQLSQISFLEQNKREAQTADVRVKSNIQTEEEEAELTVHGWVQSADRRVSAL